MQQLWGLVKHGGTRPAFNNSTSMQVSSSLPQIHGWNWPDLNCAWLFLWHRWAWNNRSHTNIWWYSIISYTIKNQNISENISVAKMREGRKGVTFPLSSKQATLKNSCNSLNIGFKRKGPWKSIYIMWCFHYRGKRHANKTYKVWTKQRICQLWTSHFEITSPSFTFIWPNHLRLVRHFF